MLLFMEKNVYGIVVRALLFSICCCNGIGYLQREINALQTQDWCLRVLYVCLRKGREREYFIVNSATLKRSTFLAFMRRSKSTLKVPFY